MATVVFFLCCVVTLFLFYLAHLLIKKEKYGLSIYPLVGGLVIFGVGQPWFQAFVKTQIISTTFSTLKEYGKKLDDFQTTTATMKTELAEHQAALEKHQKEIEEQQSKLRTSQSDIAVQESSITSQYKKIYDLQSGLETTQTNLLAQAKQIQDVEFLVNNLFSKTTMEFVLGTDTNKVMVRMFTNGVQQIIFKLSAVPIHRSIQCICTSASMSPIPLQPMSSVENVTYAYFNPPISPEHTTFTFTFVKDTRSTNLVKSVVIKNEDVYLDSRKLTFNDFDGAF